MTTSLDNSQNLVIVTNTGAESVRLDVPAVADLRLQRDLISGRAVTDDSITLQPFETVWLS